MIEMTLLIELILTKQVHKNGARFYNHWYSLNKEFNFETYVCNRCHDFIMSMKLSNITILKIKNADYFCIITGISKGKTIKLLKNIDLTEKQWNIIKNKYQSNL